MSILYDDEKELKKMIEKYNGHIVKFVSNKDELDVGVSNLMYETAGEKVIIKNGQSHSIDVFLNKDTQAKIVTELKKVKGYQDQDANNKS